MPIEDHYAERCMGLILESYQRQTQEFGRFTQHAVTAVADAELPWRPARQHTPVLDEELAARMLAGPPSDE